MKAPIGLAREIGGALGEMGVRPTDPLIDELAKAIYEISVQSDGAEAGSKSHLRGAKSGEKAVLKLKNRV